jgi:hypothetical protein
MVLNCNKTPMMPRAHAPLLRRVCVAALRASQAPQIAPYRPISVHYLTNPHQLINKRAHQLPNRHEHFVWRWIDISIEQRISDNDQHLADDIHVHGIHIYFNIHSHIPIKENPHAEAQGQVSGRVDGRSSERPRFMLITR